MGILVTHSTLLGRMTILIKAMKITLLPFKVKGLSKSMFLNFERSEKNILCKEYFTKHFAKLWSVGYRLRSRKKISYLLITTEQ